MKASDTSLMIFAAGYGTRMGALTKKTPKPMLRLHGKPMIDNAIDIAKAAGVEKIVANTYYLHTKIEPHLKSKGVTIARESSKILDTGGGLKSALSLLTSPTFTLNPDCVWDGPNPLAHLLGEWRNDMQSLLLLAPPGRSKSRQLPGDFSISEGRLTRGGDMVYTGAQIIRTERLLEISDEVFSLNRFWDLLAKTGELRGSVYPGTWVDIGSEQALNKANEARFV